MAHHGDASVEDGLHRVENLHAALHLHCIATALLHDADGVDNTVMDTRLIAAEGHVAHHKGTLDTVYHSTCMIDHLVDGHGQRRAVAHHHVGGRVADEDAIDTCTVDDACRSKIIGGEHADLLTLLFHLNEATRRYLAFVAD